jgi:Flp pilus assembly pilin Flp
MTSYLTRALVKIRESNHGQTMTEYVLILAAIAVAGYIAYQGLETGIAQTITKVTTSLAAS